MNLSRTSDALPFTIHSSPGGMFCTCYHHHCCHAPTHIHIQTHHTHSLQHTRTRTQVAPPHTQQLTYRDTYIPHAYSQEYESTNFAASSSMLNKALGKKGCLFEHPFKSDHRHPVSISMPFRLFALTLSLPPSHPPSLSVSLLSHCLSLPLSLSLFSLWFLSIFSFLSRSLSLSHSRPFPPPFFYVFMCVRALVYMKLTALRNADMYLEAWTLRSYSQCTTATNTKSFNQTPKQTNQCERRVALAVKGMVIELGQVQLPSSLQ